MKRFALIAASLILCDGAAGQELEPRRWSHLPINTNFGGIGYAYTNADIAFDPVLMVEDATLDLHTVALKYIRSFELLGKSARFDIAQAYQDARWEGLLGEAFQPPSPARATRIPWCGSPSISSARPRLKARNSPATAKPPTARRSSERDWW